MEWPQVKDLAEWEGENIVLGQARTNYNVYGIPQSFIIDHTGKLVAKDLRGEELVAATLEAVNSSGD